MPKQGRLRSINIRNAENGFIGSASYDPAESKGEPLMYSPDKDYVLADREAVHRFVDDCLGAKSNQAKKRNGKAWPKG